MTAIDRIRKVWQDRAELEDFEDCVLGMCFRCGSPDIVAYDYDKVIEKLMSQGMTPSEASDYWHSKQLGIWVGDKTPCFVMVMDKDEK